MEGGSLSLENDLRQAARDGIRISKEKLIQLMRESKQKEFVVVRGRDGSYVVVPLALAKR
jgi:hypothetical protein